MKITHIDYAILGLLAQYDLSGYQIRMVFEKTALGNFSSSPGTIYPALARLQKLGLVTKKRQQDKQTGLFGISEDGIRALKDWILQPVTKADVMKGIDMLILRIAFIDSTDDDAKRDRFFQSAEEALQAYISELEKYSLAESPNMPVGGRLAFGHGLDRYKGDLAWIRKVRLVYQSK